MPVGLTFMKRGNQSDSVSSEELIVERYTYVSNPWTEKNGKICYMHYASH